LWGTELLVGEGCIDIVADFFADPVNESVDWYVVYGDQSAASFGLEEDSEVPRLAAKIGSKDVFSFAFLLVPVVAEIELSSSSSSSSSSRTSSSWVTLSWVRSSYRESKAAEEYVELGRRLLKSAESIGRTRSDTLSQAC
jgi:hypothetical protein